MTQPITIEQFNRLMRQETLHPLVTSAHASMSQLSEDVTAVCDFYALTCKPAGASLRLLCPGDTLHIPSATNTEAEGFNGVLFHPDLLLGTHLATDIHRYPVRCRCKALTTTEQRLITDCLGEIDDELHRAIDRFTALIIVSHISLLLDYCVRFCGTHNS